MELPSKGTNAAGMRRYNERLILAAIRRAGGASKAELARATGLSPQAVTRIVDALDAERLLVEGERRQGGIGQPATVYRINAARGDTVGIEVGREGLAMVLLDADGGRKAERRLPGRFPSIDTVVGETNAFIRAQLASGAASATDSLLGIGIAMPWFLGEWRDELAISDEQAHEWRGADVADRLRAGLPWPVLFENDGNAAALAHLLCGGGRDHDNFLAIQLGTVIGGGLVLGRQVVQGRNGNAGAIASMPVCVGEARGYLMHYSSQYALDRQGGEEAVSAWRKRCVEALAFVLLGINSLLDLDAVVIDGSLPNPIVDAVIDETRESLVSNSPPDYFHPALVRGVLGDMAAATGAGLLPLHANFSPDLRSLFHKD